MLGCYFSFPQLSFHRLPSLSLRNLEREKPSTPVIGALRLLIEIQQSPIIHSMMIMGLRFFFGLPQLVAENVLAFNEGFWIRLAARTDTCKSEDDKKDYEELAATLMSTVDRLVHKTNEKIESAIDVLKSILKHVP